MTFESFSTTGIGSMPHFEPSKACDLVFDYFDIPFWPQLPKLSNRESMIAQFSEGLPGIFVENEKIYLLKDEEKITEWLSLYTDDMVSPMSRDYAQGLYEIADRLNGNRLKFYKGQITGPVTFTLSLKDEEGKLIYFDETLRELALLHLKAKVKWQIDFLKNFADEVIIFIDEPILQAVGTSAYISVEQSEAMRLINELVFYIKSLGVKVGIHCCGRADWKAVLSSGIDILNFDAFSFFDFFKIYIDQIAEFLNKGGIIAWGFVPTTDDIYSLSDEQIIKQAVDKISQFFNDLSQSIDQKPSATILTPSCGMGSLDEDAAKRVCKILKKLKEILTTSG